MSSNKAGVSGIRNHARLRNALDQIHAGRRKIATAAAAMLVVALGYHVVFGANGLTVYQAKRQETRALHEQMRDLQLENDGLQGHVQRLQDDPDSIEHQAREELHYTRPGEVIYTLSTPPDSHSQDPK